jgi:hypothetical protein
MNSAVAEIPSPRPRRPAAPHAFVDAFDGRYARIAASETLPPFLMNVVSSSDLWLFVASNGGLSAGRNNAEHALFPYQTVDRIYDSTGCTGPFTALRVDTPSGEVLWEPFAAHTPQVHRITRNLYKSIEGDRVWFEEINLSLDLVFRYGWATAEREGFVRRCELENRSAEPRTLRLIDGLRNFLPPDIDSRLQVESSCLVDAYKTAELLPDSTLATFALSSIIIDRPVPMEALRASAVWSRGLPGAAILLSEEQLGAFHAGERLTTESRRRGLRCVYALAAPLALGDGATQSWVMVADTCLTQADVVARARALASGELVARLPGAVAESTGTLRRFVAAADGVQTGGAEGTTAHHFANTLFNIMRGGVFAAEGAVPTSDFAAFVRTRSHDVATRHAGWLAGLPHTVSRATLLAQATGRDDRDLERLALEYLPLTFSRRHGDPSRPWNRFNIRMRDANGGRALNYEGNWRDIFQNWEALCLSFPEYIESIVAKFLNASTLDGYNPYRVSRDGLEWETLFDDHPWAGIGYWGDHQTVYLLKLLELSARFHPRLLTTWLRRDLFSFADVPYRIASYDEIHQRPRATITFDGDRHHEIERRVSTAGTDARLVHDSLGRILHANLTEKLLLLLLTRLTNFVPGGGIWMNTQRPEWNDANNALVGSGVSVVTLGYLRRFTAHLRDHLLPALGPESVPVLVPLAELLADVLQALAEHRRLLEHNAIDDGERRACVDALGRAGSRYRARIYGPRNEARIPVVRAELAKLLELSLAFIDHTLRANRREDGLYHAYNLIAFAEHPPRLLVRHLAPMLEGQVSILSSGLLPPAAAAALLRALRASPLYRPDQHSYLLYPDRQLPSFVERNVIAAADATGCPLIAQLLAAGDSRLVLRDADGRVRFHPALVNESALETRLALLARDPAWRELVAGHAATVKAVYESVFHHQAYTGRSGSMFGYEGLGSIYWHMVAKLLLAVQENLRAAEAAHDPAATELATQYYDIRAGLGFNKSPTVYGAFPSDPYSHTPGHAGAQQPGMTGQVKEEILTRFGELGIQVDDGCVTFRPTLLRADEFTREPTSFTVPAEGASERTFTLAAGALGFTFCGTPVVYRRSGSAPRLVVRFEDGTMREFAGTGLDPAMSREIFARTGRVDHVELELGEDFRPCTA